MEDVYFGLGSNIGNRAKFLDFGIHQLSIDPCVRVIKCSSVYQSEPLYFSDQDVFLNMVVHAKTSYHGMQLLHRIKSIEEESGRKNSAMRNRPRSLDIDILAYREMVYQSCELCIPHPKLSERKFVLIPWSEIAPDFIPPGYGESIQGLLKNCRDTSSVSKFDQVPL